MHDHAFTVGFDLDMTLADTRAGIGAVLDALSAESGVFIDSKLSVTRLGPPLAIELAHWFTADQVPVMVARFRELYAGIAVPVTTPMAGAVTALAAVRDTGGRVIVVTAKNQRDAERTIRFLDLPVDRVVGSLWAAEKGRALMEHRATVYVGDHIGDIDAARAASARSVAVATGPFDVAALRAYGADLVLPDLLSFPDRLDDLGVIG
ncbi:HAD family hydrolase [Actinomadura sp. HBU206391]|uniref:HAD family hydrolase n=1 Tax=Actinomadura sp. HBU206391 TaxID=2731692 RepID=UPI002905BF60|nr:HAD hydrolase-like protein [Actinomadura sp. HBU206391]